MHHNPLVKYRPDIDGLRALAVLSVVVFHAFPDVLPGGFVGVDIFFVISGYLISSIVFEGLEKNQFSFLDFYKRRIKRIFPALLLVLSASFAFGWFYLFSAEFRQLGLHTFAGAGFFSNIELMREIGYFDTEAELKPLLHLWSLGIEEQFYFVWPLFLWFILSKNLKTLTWLIGAILLSFFVGISGVFTSEYTFFLPFTRFWELMGGGLMAYLHQTKHKVALNQLNTKFISNSLSSLGRNAHHISAAAGMVLIISPLFLLTSQLVKLNTGWWALPTIMGALLIIAAGSKAWLNQHILASRIAIFFGLISYPLYLWHWPLLSFARIVEAESLSVPFRVSLILAAIMLAYLTYWFIERPVRRKSAIVLPLALILGMAVIGIMGLFAAKSLLIRGDSFNERDQFVARFDNRNYQYIRTNNLTETYRFQCDFYDFLTDKHLTQISQDCITPIAGRNILLWGDSHAQALFSGLRKVLPASIGIMQVATSGCTPSLLKKSDDEFGSCNRSNHLALEVVEKTKPKLAMIAQRFHHENTDWNKLARDLRKLGAENVILVGPNPQWEPALNILLARKYWPHFPQRLSAGLNKEVLKTEHLLKSAYSNSVDLNYVSLFDLFCNSYGCQTRLDARNIDDLVTWDYGHLTVHASEYVGKQALLPVINHLMPVY